MKRYQKMSRLYAPTLKEDPAEAELVSHKLLLRAGMIRKTAAGLYSYLPLAWRVISKVEDVIRDEMEGIGAQEMMSPSSPRPSSGSSRTAWAPTAPSSCA